LSDHLHIILDRIPARHQHEDLPRLRSHGAGTTKNGTVLV